eukprot:RCo030246
MVLSGGMAVLDPTAACDRILAAQGPYELLSVSGTEVTPRSSSAEVRRAYLELVQLVHPDKVSVTGARKAFQELSGAYRQITDPKALDDGWQEDGEYLSYIGYSGEWYQDTDGTWYTDHDYRDEEGNWHQRTAAEVEMLHRLRKFGVQNVLPLLQPHEIPTVANLKRQQESHLKASEKVKLRSAGGRAAPVAVEPQPVAEPEPESAPPETT